MLDKGALEIVSDPGLGFYSRLFLVEKATGGWRPVIDLSPLNKFVVQTPFRMETVASVLGSIKENDFLASIDLKDAYFQIPVHQDSRKYLRVALKGTVYQFKVLCFGLATAPQVFTRVFAVISSWAHSRGIRLLRYLDDWLIIAASEAELNRNVQALLSLCHYLGIVINEEKSDLVPKRRCKYLGMLIDTEEGRVFPTLERVEKFLSLAQDFLSAVEPPAHQWQVLLGHLASLEKLVPQGRLRMRSLQWQLKDSWYQETDPPSFPVPVSREVREDLSWWMSKEHLSRGVPLVSPLPSLHLYSDASLKGWGAHLLSREVSGVWTDEESQLHINLLELKAVFLALQSFREIATGHLVAVMCDNSTVVAYINKQGGTVSRPLCLLVNDLLRWTEVNGISLVARYIPGTSNVLADSLSRRGQVIQTEWSLHREVVGRLFKVWGRPMLDLFASNLNNQLPLYCSLVMDPLAAMVDAFLHSWDDLFVYAFPPAAVLLKFLVRARRARNFRAILVAPDWPQMAWYPDLLSLLVADPLELPQWDQLLRQSHWRFFHPAVHALRLHAWLLSSEPSELVAFQGELLERCRGASVHPLPVSTRGSGWLSVPGAVDRGSLLFRPLFQPLQTS